MRELWYRLRSQYLRWICRWCRHEARDVLDTAYLLCIKDAEEWLKDNRVTFKRYSTRRVNRAIKQAYRQQGKPVMEFQNRADHRDLSVEAMVMNRELTDVLAAAMCELPERERRIFDARHVVGLHLTDIAKNERCTVKTVNKHLSSACRILQTRLSMSGFNYSLTGVAMLLVCNANSEAGEMRLERLIDAAPAITSGE